MNKAMQWKPLSRDSQQVIRARATWCRTIKKEFRLGDVDRFNFLQQFVQKIESLPTGRSLNESKKNRFFIDQFSSKLITEKNGNGTEAKKGEEGNCGAQRRWSVQFSLNGVVLSVCSKD